MHVIVCVETLTCMLQQAAGVWCTPVPAGPASEEVTRRCRHAVAAVGPYVFIFGGLRGSTLLDDFLLADDSSGTELSICDPRSPAWWDPALLPTHMSATIRQPADCARLFTPLPRSGPGPVLRQSAGGSGLTQSTAHRQQQQCWRRQQQRKQRQQRRLECGVLVPWRTSPASMRTSATGEPSMTPAHCAPCPFLVLIRNSPLVARTLALTSAGSVVAALQKLTIFATFSLNALTALCLMCVS